VLAREVASVQQVRDQDALAAIEPRRCAVGMFSRRHIDLQRVAGALCPGTVRAS
jgi:hypothetical protein